MSSCSCSFSTTSISNADSEVMAISTSSRGEFTSMGIGALPSTTIQNSEASESVTSLAAEGSPLNSKLSAWLCDISGACSRTSQKPSVVGMSVRWPSSSIETFRGTVGGDPVGWNAT